MAIHHVGVASRSVSEITEASWARGESKFDGWCEEKLRVNIENLQN